MKGWLLVISMLPLVFAAGYGCSSKYLLQDEQGNVFGAPERRYAVLNFFFDGVPKPGGGKDAAAGAKGKGKEESAVMHMSAGEHGPYAAKMCNECHERASNALVLPVEELCMYCHVLKTKKKIHGPLVSGGCRVCHQPHGSAYQFLLTAESKEFCLYCHNKKDILKREVHRTTDEECISCHDAHSSDNEFLLK